MDPPIINMQLGLMDTVLRVMTFLVSTATKIDGILIPSVFGGYMLANTLVVFYVWSLDIFVLFI